MNKTLDEQEKQIVEQLIRDPRATDNAIAEVCGLNVRTVHRKRRRLEQEGLLTYHAQIDLSSTGTEQFATRHLFVIQFRIGITLSQLVDEIKDESKMDPRLGSLIYDSHVAESNGKLALLLLVDGKSATEIVQRVHEEIIPMLQRVHGEDSIQTISSYRVLLPVRQMRNYMPLVNLSEGIIREDWPGEFIYVAE